MTNRRFDELFGGPPATPRRRSTQREMRPGAPRSRRSPRRSCCAWPATRPRSTGERPCRASPAASPSTAWPTAACCARGRSTSSGSSRRPATPAARSARALYGWHQVARPAARRPTARPTACAGAYLGPGFTADEIERWLDARGPPRTSARRPGDAGRGSPSCSPTATVVGRVPGPDGVRAARPRAPVDPGDPRSPTMQWPLNLKIKQRESFRPFAPAVLAERGRRLVRPRRSTSPYMLLVAPVRERRGDVTPGRAGRADLRDWVDQVRSRDPGGHPRRPLGPRADRRRATQSPRSTRS